MFRLFLLQVFVALFLLCSSVLGAEIRGMVVWVYDGDTVEVKSFGVKHTVRLWGIDAPEKGQPFGKESLRTLMRLAKKRIVRVEYSEQDRYGRIIGRIYVGRKYINLEMIRTGAAWVYRKYNDDAGFAAAEKKAAKDKTGLWALDEKTPPWEYRRNACNVGFNSRR